MSHHPPESSQPAELSRQFPITVKAGGTRAIGALYLGYRKDGSLHYAGKVGTGFSMKSARDLADRFKVIAGKPTLERTCPRMGVYRVGQAGTALRGRFHRMDAGRSHPPSFFPGPAPR